MKSTEIPALLACSVLCVCLFATSPCHALSNSNDFTPLQRPQFAFALQTNRTRRAPTLNAIPDDEETGRGTRVLLQRKEEALRQAPLSTRSCDASPSPTFECSLSPKQISDILNNQSRTWLVDSDILESIDNDVQTIIDCTDPEDTVVFRVDGPIKPPRRIEVPWKLTLGTFVNTTDVDSHVDPPTRQHTTFHCPPNEGVFLIKYAFPTGLRSAMRTCRSSGAVFENMAFKRCSLNATGHAAILEVETCASDAVEGSIALHHVTFSQNHLVERMAITVANSSCTSVEMMDVEFVDNACSGVCFGRLSLQNSLMNVRMERNARIRDLGHPFPALLLLPSMSVTLASELLGRNNNLTVLATDAKGGSTVKLTDSEFSENRELSALHFMNAAVVTISRCSFMHNRAEEMSGAAFCSTSMVGSVTVTDSIFDGNTAREGGAIAMIETGSLEVRRCRFINNAAIKSGGGIWARRGITKLLSSQFDGNTAEDSGGSLQSFNASVEVENCSFTHNSAAFQGGAISLEEQTTFRVVKSRVLDNEASTAGGALMTARSSGSMWQCSFQRNSALEGGAVNAAYMSRITINTSEFLQNDATGRFGGALQVSQESKSVLVDSLFQSNSARDFGGAISVSNSTMVAQNMTVSDNRCAVVGGGLRIHETSAVNISDSVFLSNTAAFGGCLTTRDSILNVVNTQFEKCMADNRGGGLNIEEGSTVSFRNSTIVHCTADGLGGGIHCRNASVSGHRLTLSSNGAKKYGGGLSATEGSFVTLTKSEVCRNRVRNSGGGLALRSSTNGIFTDVLFHHNNASEGGSLYLDKSKAVVDTSRFADDEASKGGSIAAMESDVTARSSSFRNGSAEMAGGCIDVRQNGTLTLVHTNMTSCRSRKGGAVSIITSNLTCVGCEFRDCNASKAGGGIFAGALSFVLCSSSSFENNVADVSEDVGMQNSTGGAVSISPREPLGLTYQFFKCRFFKNRARIGGAIHLLSESANKNCENPLANCSFVALVETLFLQNSALAGGAIFASYPKAFRYNCSSSSEQTSRDFYDKKEFSTLHSIDTTEEPCLASNNKAENFGYFVGSYARKLQLSIKYKGDEEFVDWDETRHIEQHKSGDALPVIRLSVTDEFGQGPAFGAWNTSVRALVWSPEKLFTGNISAALDNGMTELSGIATLQSAGDYSVRIDFPEIDLRNLTIHVNVRPCSLGESTDKSGKFCFPCSATEFNFRANASNCQPCPDNGDCTPERVIHPKPGYWHSYPCSDRIQECPIREACDFEERQQKLTASTEDILHCDCDMNVSKLYGEVQCKKGYKGFLCGSCDKAYGRIRALKCTECRAQYANVLMYCLSVLLLLLLSSFAIKSHLASKRIVSSLSRQIRTRRLGPNPSQSDSLMLVEMTATREPHSDGTTGPHEPANRPHDSEQLSREAELIKQRLLEVFKITVNFFQVVAVAVSMNMNWTTSIIQLFSAIDFVGGAAAETVTLPIDCLLPSDADVPRSVLSTAVFMCIPVLVGIFFVVFWATAVYRFAETWQYFTKKLVLSCLVVAYLSYEIITKAAINIFACTEVLSSCGEDEELALYWTMDTSIRCYERSHAALVGVLGWPVLLFFSLGYPLGLTLVLISFKTEKRKRNSWFSEVTGFLYHAYNDRFVFWESIIMFRKSFLALIVAFGYSLGANVQGILAVTGVAIALYGHMFFRPFKEEFHGLNAYESASLAVSELTFISGLFFHDDRVSQAVRVLLSIFLFSAIGGLSFFFVSRIFTCIASYARVALELEGIDDVKSSGRVQAVWALFALRAQVHVACLNKTREIEEETCDTDVNAV